jgi:ribosomal protein S18 acetylase RimI-like enzyme
MEMVRTDLKISREQGGIFCGIYRLDGTLVGIVDYVPRNFEGDPQSAFLSLLMIDKAFRSRGIGSAVVAAIEAEIRKDTQIHTIFSGVQVNNPQAVQFWQRQGYRIISGPTLMPDQTTVFALRKDFSLEG